MMDTKIYSNQSVLLLKKYALLTLITLLFVSCSSIQSTKPDYLIGINKNSVKKKVQKDSILPITPRTVNFKYLNIKASKQKEYEKLAKEVVIRTLKSELNTTKMYDLDILSKSDRSINKVLERILYDKYANPNWIIKAPDEILIPEKYYTILIEIVLLGNDSFIEATIINNELKIIERVDRYNFKSTFINEEILSDSVKKVLSNMIKT